MSVIIHFLNGNDESIESHYLQKEYRNDVIVEIHGKFYEVYFFVSDSLEFEMRKDGFFSLPGIIILDEIRNEKIYTAINYLIGIGFFDNFVGSDEIALGKTFSHKWYQNKASPYKLENKTSYLLKE